MTADVKQVGGTHYQVEAGRQHWDLMEDHDIAYLEATATKYVVRWRQKGGVEDLKKAVTYLEKMDGRGPRRLVKSLWALNRFIEDSKLGETEGDILTLILFNENTITEAIRLLNKLIEENSK